MKLGAVEKEVVRSDTKGGGKFAIEANAKAFQILSSNLYSDRILAIIRELSCNAYDSHVAAGCASTAFEMQLPTTITPRFYVRDFGTGLDDHDIRGRWVDTSDDAGNEVRVFEHGIYTTFFSSSKSNSNDYIGALGLGSKSPFSYAQSFFVTSWFGGVERTYTMFINEDGEPEVQLMNERDSDEPTGLKVELAVKPEDSTKFYEAAKTALQYFTPTPTVKGRSDFWLNVVEHVYEGAGWKIRKPSSRYTRQSARVVQGFVAYPIAMDQLPDLPDLYRTVLRETPIDLFVPIGDVNVAPSREHLTYDKSTVANLTKYIINMMETAREPFELKLSQCTTQWQALMWHLTNQGEATSVLYNSMYRVKPFTWRGQPIANAPYLVLTRDQACDAQLLNATHTYKRANIVLSALPVTMAEEQLRYRVVVHADTVVYVDDTHGTSKGKRALKRVLSADGSNSKTALVVMPTNAKVPGKAADADAAVKVIIKQLGNPDTILVSSIIEEQDCPPKKPRQVKPKTVFPTWDGFAESARRQEISYTYNANCWADAMVAVDDGGFYVPVDRHRPVLEHGRKSIERLDVVVQCLETIGLIPSGTTVVGVNASRLKMFQDESNWINVVDLINRIVADDKCVNQALRYQVSRLGINAAERAIAVRPLIKMMDRISDTDIVRELKWFDEQIKFTVHPEWNRAHAIHTLMLEVLDSRDVNTRVVVPAAGTCDAHSSELSKAMDNYKLAVVFGWRLFNEVQCDALVEFINMQRGLKLQIAA